MKRDLKAPKLIRREDRMSRKIQIKTEKANIVIGKLDEIRSRTCFERRPSLVINVLLSKEEF